MLADEAATGTGRLHVAAAHADAEDDARSLLDAVRSRADVAEGFLTPVTPVIGVSAGPGLVALAWWREGG
jgi:fatty acid-binding protein DegV